MTTQYIRYPNINSNVAIYATLADFPTIAIDGSLAVAADTDIIYVFNLASLTWLPKGNGGTVTSVAVSGANGIGVSGSPITSSGTIALTLGTITGATWNGNVIGSIYGGTGIAGGYTNGQLLIGRTSDGILLASTLTAGANTGVVISNGAGSITLSTIQDIRTTAAPQFLGLTLVGTSVNAHVLQIGAVSDSGAGAQQVVLINATQTGSIDMTTADGLALNLSYAVASGKTITKSRQLYVGVGALTGAGAVTTAYSAYFEEPNFGTTKICGAFFGRVDIGTTGQFSVSRLGVITTGTYQGTVIDGTYINYNTTNLTVTASKLNTIQDIASSSSPTFAGITINGDSILNGNLDVNMNSSSTADGNAVRFYGIIPGGSFATLAGILSAHTFTPTINTTDYSEIEISLTGNIPTSTTLTNAYGLKIDQGSKTGVGTITNGFGLFVQKPTYGTNIFTARILGRTQIGISQQADFSDTGVLTLTTALAVTSGGIGLSTVTQGDILYASASNALSALAKNVIASRYLSNSGTSNNPAWSQVDLTNGVVNVLPIANGGTGYPSNFTNGQILIGRTSDGLLIQNTITAGTGISVTNGAGTITLASTLTLPVPVTSGGTGLSSVTQGDILYASASNTLSTLAKNVIASRYLSNTGTSNNPAWSQIDLTTGVLNVLSCNNGGTGYPSNFTNGQILIGRTSDGLLVQTTITAGTGITVTNGAGAITIASSLTLPVTVANGGTGTSTAFTTGSVVFAGASGVYTQDNANFFWDNTNKRLGIGTVTPTTLLEISGSPTATIPYSNTARSTDATAGPWYNSLNYGRINLTGSAVTSTFAAHYFAADSSIFNISSAITSITMQVFGPIKTGNGSITNAYSMQISAPTQGSTVNVALKTENLIVGTASSTPPTNGMFVGGNVLFGTTTNTTGTTSLNIASTTQASSRIVLTGQEFYQAAQTSTDGIAIIAGVNRSGNRQLWIADSSALTQNTTNTALQIGVGSGLTNPIINAVATNGTTALNLGIQTGGGNLAIFTNGSYGGGAAVIFIANRTTAPTSNPSGGGLLSVNAGALVWRGSSGTVTTIAAA